MISCTKLLVILLALGFATNCLGNDYFEKAVAACTKGQYNTAIAQLTLIEKEVGRPTPRVESLRVYAFVGLQDWVQAKIALNRYKRLAPNATSPAHQALLKLEPQIDAGVAQLEAKWQAEVAKRAEAELKQLRAAEENSRQSAEAGLRARAAAVERLQKRAQASPEPEFVSEIADDPNAKVADSPDFTTEDARRLLADLPALLAWLQSGYRDGRVEGLLRDVIRAGAPLGIREEDLLIRQGRQQLYGLSRSLVAPLVVRCPRPSSGEEKMPEYLQGSLAEQLNNTPDTNRLADSYTAGGIDFVRFDRSDERYRDPKSNQMVAAKNFYWTGGAPGRVPLVELTVLLKRGYELTNLSFLYGQWHASFSVPPRELGLSFKLNQPAPASQYVLTGQKFPDEEYQRLSQQGYLLRDLQFTANQWIVILSKLPEGTEPADEGTGPRILTAGSYAEVFQKLVTARQNLRGARDSLIKIQANRELSEWAVMYHETQNTLQIEQFLLVDDDTDELLRFLTQHGLYEVVFASDTGLKAEADSIAPTEDAAADPLPAPDK